MWVSLPANPIPFDRYRVDIGYSGRHWLPWYIWGGGTYATKYDFDQALFIGYRGALSVPLFGGCVRIRQMGVRGAVNGSTAGTEGAFLLVRLYEQHGNIADQLAEIAVDRRTIPNSVIGTPHIDVVQSAGDFTASARTHSLTIDVIGLGQAIATVYALMVDVDF